MPLDMGGALRLRGFGDGRCVSLFSHILLDRPLFQGANSEQESDFF
jgi:hypothetical protein